MRNNQDRLGAPETPETSDAAPVLAQQGADFSFVAANDIVELPSKGEFYPQGHPLKDNPVVEVKQMTAKEEDILMNQSYLKQGVVVERLLQSLVLANGFNIDDLLIGDKNAILTQVRRSAYGDEYPVETVCRSCYSPISKTFDLEECVRHKHLVLPEGVERTENNTFKFTAPGSKALVELRFLTSADEKTLSEKEKKYKKHNIDFSLALETYKLLILSVNNNPTLVGQYVDQMPLKDSKYIRNLLKDMQPGIEMKGEYECDNCNSGGEIDLPINFRFLWPDL